MNAPTQSQIRDALWSMPPNTFLLDSDVSAWFRLNSDTIRDVLQSALDTQKPAGDAAEALDWFNGILDVFHSKYEATEPDKEAEHISTICAALTPKPSGGDVELQDVIDWADGVAGALGTEYASRVTDTEAAVAMGVKAALTPAPIDVEALKRDYKTDRTGMSYEQVDGWNDCIDHLHATGRLCAPLPEIKGLDEALDEADHEDFRDIHPDHEAIVVPGYIWLALIAAARAYRERMG